MSIEEIPRLSTKEALILKLLIDEGREMYGLEMVERSNDNLKRSTVYVFLARMEKKGYIKSKLDPGAASLNASARGTSRRMYKIQKFGRRAYAALQAAEHQFNK